MISRLLQKHCWSSSKETALIKRCLLLTFLFQFVAQGFQLENWRQPFFNIASEFGYSGTSPSRMFWDDISDATLFDSSIWSISKKLRLNHWYIEPNIAAGILMPSVEGQKPGFFHVDLLNNLKFHNITVRQTLDVDKRYEEDPLYPAHPERAVRGRIEEAFIQLDWKYGFFAWVVRNVTGDRLLTKPDSFAKPL